MSQRTTTLGLLGALALTGCLNESDPQDFTDDEMTSEADSEISTSTHTERMARIVAGSLQVRDLLQTNSAWVTIASNVAGVRLAADRIVIRKNDSSVWAKDGPIATGTFSQLAPAGSAIEIAASGTVIAYRSTAGKVAVKVGALTAAWSTYVASGAKRIAVAGCGISSDFASAAVAASKCVAASRVGYIDSTDALKVKTISGAWKTVATGVADLHLQADRSAYRTLAGAFWTDASGAWVKVVGAGVTSIAIGLDAIAFTTSSPAAGSLYTLSSSNLGTPFAEPPKFQRSGVGSMSITTTTDRMVLRTTAGDLFSNAYPETQFGTPWQAEGNGTMIMLSRPCDVSNLGGEGYLMRCF